MGFKFYIDWGNNASFADGIDDISAYVMGAKWRLGMRRMYQSVGDESTLELALNNASGRFNPENSSSPLYGNVQPRRRVRVVWDNGVTQTDMILVWIEKIEPDWEPDRK